MRVRVATKRAYVSDWDHFQSWCAAAWSVPPASLSSDRWRVSGQSCRHFGPSPTPCRPLPRCNRSANFQIDTRHPAIRDVLRGLRRAKGTAQDQAGALTTTLIKRLVETCGQSLIDLRDRAALLLAFGGRIEALRNRLSRSYQRSGRGRWPCGSPFRARKAIKRVLERSSRSVRTGRPTCPVAAIRRLDRCCQDH